MGPTLGQFLGRPDGLVDAGAGLPRRSVGPTLDAGPLDKVSSCMGVEVHITKIGIWQPNKLYLKIF